MFVYVFRNEYQNYLSGEFYFAAENKKDAITMSKKFEKDHYDSRDGYRIKFNFFERVKVKPGHLPLNRSM